MGAQNAPSRRGFGRVVAGTTSALGWVPLAGGAPLCCWPPGGVLHAARVNSAVACRPVAFRPLSRHHVTGVAAIPGDLKRSDFVVRGWHVARRPRFQRQGCTLHRCGHSVRFRGAARPCRSLRMSVRRCPLRRAAVRLTGPMPPSFPRRARLQSDAVLRGRFAAPGATACRPRIGLKPRIVSPDFGSHHGGNLNDYLVAYASGAHHSP